MFAFQTGKVFFSRQEKFASGIPIFPHPETALENIIDTPCVDEEGGIGKQVLKKMEIVDQRIAYLKIPDLFESVAVRCRMIRRDQENSAAD